MSSVDSNNDASSIATAWLQLLSAAATSADVNAFVDLFVPTGWMRDLLCFSWDFRCLSGRSKITSYLSEAEGAKTKISRAGLHNFRIEPTSTLGPPTFFPIPSSPNARGVQATFNFSASSPPRSGRGFVRLVQDQDLMWKANTVLFSVEDLVGHEEPRVRPLGVFSNLATWDEVQGERATAIERDPPVLIVGGGLAGLTCAARLGRMGVGALVLEKDPRIGDVWRKRYPNLHLHSAAHYCSVLYHPYPKTYPKYLPKEKLANFLEAYATGEDLVIWLSSTVLPTPTYDPTSRRWTVTVDRMGRTTILKPRHIVMATGNGKAYVPSLHDMDKFCGPIYHSDEHHGATHFKGKRAVVIGACNAAADICIDFVRKGAASVTMVQRSATCVISGNTADKLVYDVTYNEKFAVEDADFANQSMPMKLLLQLAAAGGTQRQKAMDQDLFDGLSKAGFKLTWELTPGGGEVGVLGFVAERTAAGSMLDMGCGQLIIDGKVTVKHGTVDRFESNSVILADGSSVPADVVVLATGYRPVIDNVIELFGPSITEKIGTQIWGLDDEGEFRRCYRPTGQPGLWICMGMFQHCRFFSKHLALQILAEELGLKT